MKKLTSLNVRETGFACFYPEGTTEENLPEDAVKVEGITSTLVFNPEKLKENHADIVGYLEQLPEECRVSNDIDGLSFLAMCVDKNKDLWGQHPEMQMLLCLGLAIERVKFVMPRPVWRMFPGGMPYFQYIDEEAFNRKKDFKVLPASAYAIQAHNVPPDAFIEYDMSTLEAGDMVKFSLAMQDIHPKTKQEVTRTEHPWGEVIQPYGKKVLVKVNSDMILTYLHGLKDGSMLEIATDNITMVIPKENV